MMRGPAGAGPLTQDQIGAVLKAYDISLLQWAQIITLYPIEERILYALRLLTVERGIDAVQMSQTDLGELLYCARESVCRALGRLVAEGRVERTRRSIALAKKEARP